MGEEGKREEEREGGMGEGREGRTYLREDQSDACPVTTNLCDSGKYPRPNLNKKQKLKLNKLKQR